MQTYYIALLVTIMALSNLHAQPFNLPLWPEGQIPNYRHSGEQEAADTSDVIRIRLVQNPDMAIYLPSKKYATGQAVVVCPGGGYQILAYDWEGLDIAKWLNSHGIAAIVLKYRLPVAQSNVVPHLSPLMDAQRAMRLVRHHAEAWSIDPARVGIMGFSAGGHLASTLSTHFDPGNPQSSDPVEHHSCRPDFSILIYPVISSDSAISHNGSFLALLGENPDPALLTYYSNELQVTPETPPTILIHSADDKSVPVENSMVYFKALKAHGIPAEMHIYPYGGHGYSLAIGKGYLSTWPDRVIDWLKTIR